MIVYQHRYRNVCKQGRVLEFATLEHDLSAITQRNDVRQILVLSFLILRYL